MSDMRRVAIQERRTGKADHRNQDGDDLLDTALFFIPHVLLSKESSNAEGIGRPAERGSGLRNVQTCPHWIVCVSGPPLELKSICQRHLTSLLGVVIPSNGVGLTWSKGTLCLYSFCYQLGRLKTSFPGSCSQSLIDKTTCH